jgi:hypothetical protein
VSQIIPKIFTGFAGEELVQNKSFKVREPFALFASFLDRTVVAQRPEKRR